MDRAKVREIRKQLEGILKIPGMTVEFGKSARFTRGAGGSVTFKVTLTEPQPSGKVAEPQEVRDFKQQAHLFGLKSDDLGRTFVSRGETFMVTGLLARCYKNPIAATRSDGKKFKFPAEDVQIALARTGGAKPPPAPIAATPNIPLQEILEELREIEAEFSPENLSCDGELKGRQLQMKIDLLNKRKADLIKRLGRTPTPEELNG